MTLLEVLLATALVALLLVSLNTFVFSMGELWGRNSDARLFDQHARAVTQYLQNELRSAVLPPAATVGDTPIAPREVVSANYGSQDLITFLLPTGGRLLNWTEAPLPEVVCSLEVRPNEGLFLLWHSRLEENFDVDPPRETLISPLVSALEFDYFDDTFQAWSTEPALKSGDEPDTFETPQRLRLKFAYKQYTYDGLVSLPQPREGLPWH